MTADQRIEKLLNRAGQTLTKDYATDYPHTEEFRKHMGEVVAKHGGWYKYTLHMTDIIDKLETALENVCGERDYLLQRFKREMQCKICVHELLSTYEEPCNSCLDKNETPYFEYTGVPEGWRVDDE